MHRFPHPPQLFGLLDGSTHCPLHRVVPAPHSHVPEEQLAPVGHTVPQAPQSDGSLVRSTQALEQLVRPVPQFVVQTPAEHT